MKMVRSPLGPRSTAALVRAYSVAKMVNTPMAWRNVIAFVPKSYCLVGVKAGAPVFGKAEKEPVPAGWKEEVASWAERGLAV